MATGLLTELPLVAKDKAKEPSSEPTFGRIELQAEPEWIKYLDAMAKAVGMNRSSYIRNACNVKMAGDAAMLGRRAPKPPDPSD